MTTPAVINQDQLFVIGSRAYRRLGWGAAVPCEAKTKKLRVSGVSGHKAIVPDPAVYAQWEQQYASDNVALVMPPGVIGIDVDHYDDGNGKAKFGMDSLAQLQERLGPLPPTWVSTAREDGQSGIRFFRVPPGGRYRGVVAPCIEVIQQTHRYALVWPSIHPTGGTYTWYSQCPVATADGQQLLNGHYTLSPASIPSPENLPELPDAWLDYLTVGSLSEVSDKLSCSDGEALAWAKQRSKDEVMCLQNKAHVLAFMDQLADPKLGSRHDTARAFICDVIRGRVAEGHRGAAVALSIGKDHWLAAMSDEPRDVNGEWDRMVAGAARMPFGRTELWEDLEPVHTCLVVPSVKHLRLNQLWGDARVFLSDNPDEWTVRLEPDEYREWLAQYQVKLSIKAQANPESLTAKEQELLHQDTTPLNQRTGNLGKWQTVDLTDMIMGTAKPVQPKFLERTDGASCFYPGMINGLIGPSESAKSWVAMYAMSQALKAGQVVCMIDFEDMPATIIHRLRKLGVTDDMLLTRFRYMSPDEAFGLHQRTELLHDLAIGQPELIVLDGYNMAMSRSGLNPMANEDVMQFSAALLHLLAEFNRTVLYIDHTPKHRVQDVAGAIGAQAKRADTSGCIIAVEAKIKPAPGQLGRLILTVDKDRHGGVRENAVMVDGKAIIGEVVMDETDADKGLRMMFFRPPTSKVAEADPDHQEPTPSESAPRLGALSVKTSELLESGTPHRTRGELPPAPPVPVDDGQDLSHMTADQYKPMKKVERPKIADLSLVHPEPEKVMNAFIAILRDGKNILPKGDKEWPEGYDENGRHGDRSYSIRDFRNVMSTKNSIPSIVLGILEKQGKVRKDPARGGRWAWVEDSESYPQEQ